MKLTLLQQFRPTLLFLAKFLGLYVTGSILYGLWITAYHPAPDPVTVWVTEQTAFFIRLFGWEVSALAFPSKPTTSVVFEGHSIISVYEGCNGINVIIIFWSFLFAFGPVSKRLLIYSLAGLLIIHVANLFRIGLLFFVSIYYSRFLFFTHKYLFTAIIYAVVFGLWVFWVSKNFKKRTS